MPSTTTVTQKKSTSPIAVVDKRRFTKTGKAPLVQTDINELGDKRLNPEEMVYKLREDILKQESKKRIYGQDELQQIERSAGPRIHTSELIKRLQKINPGIHVKDGKWGSVALYYKKKRFEYKESDFFETPPNGEFFTHHKYVGGFELGWLPEWGHVTVDSSNVALHEVRGWRSVLISLIKAKVISYQAAITEFGNPVGDKRSRFWFEQLFTSRKSNEAPAAQRT
jgi:hypothetical protein